MSRTNSSIVTIRRAGAADLGSLALLASLDDAAPPVDPVLVAESEGHLLAAVPFDGGRAIADPFEPTAEVVALLELRARQIREAEASRANRAGPLRRLRARVA
jgi:hypothetical protein